VGICPPPRRIGRGERVSGAVNAFRAVLFDFDNTLVNYTLAEKEALTATLRHFGIIRDERDWDAFFACYEPVSSDHWRKRDGRAPRDMTLMTFRDTLERFLGRSDVAEQITDMYWDRFCNTCHLEPGARELLSHLSGRYRLGLVTNGYAEAQRKRLAACGIGGLFQAVVISDEVGLRKPDPRMFDLALRQLDASPDEALYVGDSIQDDYRGARNAGLAFCYYNPGRKPLEPDVSPDFVVDSLERLKAVLSGIR